MSTLSLLWMPIRKFSQSIESRSTWSRSSSSSVISPASTSGAMPVSTESTSLRISSVFIESPLELVGLLEQLVDRGQEQRAAVSVARPVVGRERGSHVGGDPDALV